GDRRLVAYVAPASVDGNDVRAYLAKRLPDYMVPSAVVALESLPTTANRKLDRAALPVPGQVTRDPGRAATGLEVLLCGIFADVLGVPAVAPDDDFFAMGGNSLMSVRIRGRVRTATGVDLSLRTL